MNHYSKPTVKYTLQVGDECLVAPLSLFHTELLNITGPGKFARIQKLAQPDPEDCFDAEYLRETGVSIQLFLLLLILSVVISHEIVLFNFIEERCTRTTRPKLIRNRWIE